MSGVKALVAALAFGVVAPAEMRITSASNVRLRATPSTDAAVIAELPLGTVTTVIESAVGGADRWSRVETADRQRGWLVARLTSPFDPSRPLDAIESIIRDRLQSWSGDTVRWNFRGKSFAASEQLVGLIERTEPQLTDVEQRGRFALYRLRALDAALARITEKLAAANPIRTWLQRHPGVAVPSLGGGPILSSDYIAKTYAEHAGTTSADDIAWVAAEVGWGGECEGDLPCYARWQNGINGEYLRRQPNGRHVAEALGSIATSLNGILDHLMFSYPKVFAEFVPARHCGELRSYLDPLRAAVDGSSAAQKTAALDAIERYAKLCK